MICCKVIKIQILKVAIFYRRSRVALHHTNDRLQNSPYFCVFKYTRAVKQKVWNEAENRERDWGETLKIRFFLSPHTPYGRVRLARFARVRLLRHALPISLLIFRKKPTVLQSIQTSVHFGNFAELYRRSRKTYHFKTWRFC